ncbi:MAG: hypothetical protein AB1508_03100 [Pseudomonadota bacterium]
MTLLTDDLRRTDGPAKPGLGAGNRVVRAQRAASAIVVLQILLVVSVWLLSRGYLGILHDARIYIGRALADLDPDGIGRDALFAFDGQTHLTVYSFLTLPLVRLLGASMAAIVITYTTLLIWLAAAAWLACQMMPRRLIAAALICVAALPAVYGPFGIFSFGEPFAVPRGLAEAGVLFALAAVLSRRRFLAGGALVVSLALHAPTALAGAGVVFIMLASETPILWLIALAAGAAALVAGLLHLGPAKILFETYDPSWLAIIRARNPFLFESLWPAAAWSQAAVSGATLLTAAALTQGRVRHALAATAAVALIGILTAYILGELSSDILILQLQPWRTLWLVKLLALVMAPLCASSLWSDGRTDSRLVLILLACAWYVADIASMALPLSLMALVLLARSRSGRPDQTPKPFLWLTAFVGLCLVLLETFGDVIVAAHLWRAASDAGASFSARLLLPLLHALGFLAAASAIALSIRRWPVATAWQVASLAALVALLLPFSLASADHREPTRRMADIGAGRDTLTELLGPTPNGVVWIENDVAPLFWAGRPTWVNGLQGTAGAFSRPLAMQWDKRSRLLVANGLATENERDPYLPLSATELDPAKVAQGAVAVCKTADGPDAIIAPFDLTKYFPSGRVKIWHTPIRNVRNIEVRPQGFFYVKRDFYSVLRCADLR